MAGPIFDLNRAYYQAMGLPQPLVGVGMQAQTQPYLPNPITTPTGTFGRVWVGGQPSGDPAARWAAILAARQKAGMPPPAQPIPGAVPGQQARPQEPGGPDYGAGVQQSYAQKWAALLAKP